MSSDTFVDFSLQQVQPSDDQLLSEAKGGDRRAFAKLCLRYRGLLVNTIFRIVRNRDDTDDVLQDTFLNAYKHLHDFRGNCRISTWLSQIGINVSLMLLRKRKTKLNTASVRDTDDERTSQMYEVPDYRPNPEERYIWDETRQRLEAAIRRLPADLRRIIQLYYEKEQRLKEVALTLGISEAAAKSRMLRARNRLRRTLNNRCSLTRSKQ
jgi:RNA polymerase sigma-70 factor, ECF subfamily